MFKSRMKCIQTQTSRVLYKMGVIALENDFLQTHDTTFKTEKKKKTFIPGNKLTSQVCMYLSFSDGCTLENKNKIN